MRPRITSPTTIPSFPTVTRDVFDIVVVKDFVLPVNLTVCSTLRSDHFPVTLDLRGRSSFKGPSRPAKLETSRLDSLPGPLVRLIERNPRVDSVEDIDARLDELTNFIHDAISASPPNSKHAKQPLVSIPPTILANRLFVRIIG